MSDNNIITEYDFDFKYITSFFNKMDNLGPGSKEATEKAASFLPKVSENAIVLDLGCGTGRQTIDLANSINGKIYAIDIAPEMVEKTASRIKEANLENRVSSYIGSMDNLKELKSSLVNDNNSLSFKDESIDIIWAEGSIYHIGFENGLKYWHKLLKKNGIIGLTECCWTSNKRPNDKEWLEENIVEIDTIDKKLKSIMDIGYEPIASFILDEKCWTDNYYAGMSRRIDEFLDEHGHDSKSVFFTNMLKYEIEYYMRNKEYYSYVFFIMKKL